MITENDLAVKSKSKTDFIIFLWKKKMFTYHQSKTQFKIIYANYYLEWNHILNETKLFLFRSHNIMD